MQTKKMLVCGAIILVAVVLDQLTKFQIISHFMYGERLSVISGLFDLILVYNPGAAFSFLADANGWQKFVFMGLALVISIFLLRGIWRNEFGTLGNIGAAMIVGGAAGNVIDRILYGHVIDFLLFYYHDWFYPAFNLADSFICVGAICFVIDGILRNKKQPTAD